MTYSLVMLVMFAHWVADFVCQSDRIAKNKSKCYWTLATHVLIYSLVLGLVAGVPLYYWYDVSETYIVTWVYFNGALHFFADFVTSRLTSKLLDKGDTHNFFVVVGLDQLIHTACLLGTSSILV